MKEKPICKLVGENGNVYNLLSIARRTLMKVKRRHEADELKQRVFKARSYDEALRIIMDYVTVE